MREAIHNTIEASSNYRLTLSNGEDWPICKSNHQPEIQIVVSDEAPNSDVGMQYAIIGPTHVRRAMPTLLFLNFQFKMSFKNCASPPAYRQNCITVIAVHETMHALGVLHEQYNTDLRSTNRECYLKIRDTFAKDYQGTDVWPITAYDPDSIMNYCNQVYSHPPNLSGKDVKTLQVMEGGLSAR